MVRREPDPPTRRKVVQGIRFENGTMVVTTREGEDRIDTRSRTEEQVNAALRDAGLQDYRTGETTHFRINSDGEPALLTMRNAESERDVPTDFGEGPTRAEIEEAMRSLPERERG